MVNVLFICHGNICRSTMAEFYMKHIVNEAGLTDSIYIESAATSREEIGNDTHYGTKQKLDEMGIPYTRRNARQVTIDDYHNFDYLIIMDENNARNLRRIIGDDVDHKVHKAMSFVGEIRDVKDPWYTGNFDETYDDVSRSCDALLQVIQKNMQYNTPLLLVYRLANDRGVFYMSMCLYGLQDKTCWFYRRWSQ